MFLNPNIHSSLIDQARLLAETPVDDGGWLEYFPEDAKDAEKLADPANAHTFAATVHAMENTKHWLASKGARRRDARGFQRIDETVTSNALGGFGDFLFPMLRASVPNNAVNDLFSVQPTNSEHAKIVYLNYTYGSSKGGIAAGTILSGATTGVPYTAGGNIVTGYTYESVSGEVATIVSNALAHAAAWKGSGLRPGSVSVTLTHSANGSVTYVDNGNGLLVQTAGTATALSSGTVNYLTGAIAAAASSGNFTAGTVAYNYVGEGALAPEIDFNVSVTAVAVERQALTLKWTAEAIQRARSQISLDVEEQMAMVAAGLLNHETALKLISRAWAAAGSAVSTLSLTVPSGISQKDHFESLGYQLSIASEAIQSATRIGQGNWLVVDSGAHNVLRALVSSGAFEPATVASTNLNGLHYIGMLYGQYRVYKLLELRNMPGASTVGNFLMGWKGSNFYDAGLVYSPYYPLYSTDTVQTADFVSQKGMASSSAIHMVNDRFYKRVSLTS